MKRLSIPLALVLATSAAGCRSGANQALLERDLRHQEDRIYHLESNLADYKQWLEATRLENEDLRDQLAKNAPATSSRRSTGASSSDLSLPHVSLPGGDQVPPFSGPPQISPPNPAIPEGKMQPEFEIPPKVELPGAEGIKAPTPRPAEQGSATQAEQGDVANITLHSELTGGYNADTVPGDEGVMVVIQPHGPDGEVIAVPAKVSVVAIDPAVNGDAGRIARWNFTAEQAAEHAQQTPSARGLHFHLVWPQNPPAHKSLKLFVRYITPDGRKFDVEKAIEVEPPPRQARAWIRSVNPAPVPSTIVPQPMDPPSAAQPPPTVNQSDRSAALPKRGPGWAPYR